MNNHEDHDEEMLTSDNNNSTSAIDAAAIASASAEAFNGPNGKDVCKAVRLFACVLGIVCLAWIYEGGKKE